MKTSLIIIFVCTTVLSGCSGLSVQWVASYSTTDLATAIKMPTVVAPTPAPSVPVETQPTATK